MVAFSSNWIELHVHVKPVLTVRAPPIVQPQQVTIPKNEAHMLLTNSRNSISSPVCPLFVLFCPRRPIMSPMSPGKFWSFQLKGDMAYPLVCLSVCPSVAKKWHELCVSSVKRDTWGTYVFLLLLCEKSNRNLVSVSKHILSLFVLCAYTSCMYVHVCVYMYLYCILLDWWGWRHHYFQRLEI